MMAVQQMRPLMLVCMLLLLTACQKEEAEPEVAQEEWNVLVLFPADGLGDLSYNDNTLHGIERAALERNITARYFVPEADNDVEELFELLIRARLDENEHLLLVLAGSEYRDFARRMLSDITQNESMDRKHVLLFESSELEEPVHTFTLPFYGTSYLLGYCAAHYSSQALMMAGSSSDPSLTSALTGFEAGFEAGGGAKPTSLFLSGGPNGYSMPTEAYEQAYQWSKENGAHGFIYPVAGGSNQGVYRFAREHKETIYTAGMDVEQSSLSTDIIASVVKHTDKVIYQFILDWVDGKELPKHTDYGMESGMIELIPAPAFEKEVTVFKEEAWEKALDLERGFGVEMAHR